MLKILCVCISRVPTFGSTRQQQQSYRFRKSPNFLEIAEWIPWIFEEFSDLKIPLESKVKRGKIWNSEGPPPSRNSQLKLVSIHIACYLVFTNSITNKALHGSSNTMMSLPIPWLGWETYHDSIYHDKNRVNIMIEKEWRIWLLIWLLQNLFFCCWKYLGPPPQMVLLCVLCGLSDRLSMGGLLLVWGGNAQGGKNKGEKILRAAREASAAL